MLVISYDISDNKLRRDFSKMLTKNGAIRLQFSVYEMNYSKRYLDNIILQIENNFMKCFTMDDSVIIFDISTGPIRKFGNSIHRDEDIVFL